MKTFTTIPFFRIIIPFISGILAGIAFDISVFSPLSFCLILIPLIFLNYYASAGIPSKWLFLICADGFLFMYGTILVQEKDLTKQKDFYANRVNTDSVFNYIAVINDLPQEKEKSVKCDLKILEVKTESGYANVRGNIIAYFKKPQAESLKVGQTLFIRGKLSDVPPPQNPFEFDYRNYLYFKQIYHTAFVDQGSFEVLPFQDKLNPVWRLGLFCKELILTRLKDSPLSKNSFGICSALLTGYDEEIDKPVLEAFSHSGTLHVLSVSGLHTGLLYLALNFLFDFFDRKRKYRLMRFFSITVFLWFFALITGFSAPVLRAVIMFNLLGLGKIYFRTHYRNQINILLVSAFALLNYNPFYVMDIGFLLSYFALFGLIYFQPRLSKLWQPTSVLMKYTWQSITASFAATISTLPITLFCFKQFPLWFFVCNIVVVPATFLLLILALLVVFKINPLAILINYIVAALVGFINVFNSENSGFVDNIHFTFIDTFYLSVLIILFSIAVQYRSYKQLAASIVVLISWQFISLVNSFNAKNASLVSIYNVKGKTVISVKNKTRVRLSDTDPRTYNYHVKPHLNSFNYPDIGSGKFNYLKNGEESILILNNLDFWPDTGFADITTLVVANNFKLTEADLLKFKHLEMLVLDASNNAYTVHHAEELSRKFGIGFYATQSKGAWLLSSR